MQEIEFKDIRVGDRIRGVDDPAATPRYSVEVVVTRRKNDALFWGEGKYDYLGLGEFDTWHLVDRPVREIKVGDRVRRENPEGVTLEFTVHSCSGGYISPKYGADPDQRLPGVVYDGSTFEVVEP